MVLPLCSGLESRDTNIMLSLDMNSVFHVAGVPCCGSG